MTPRSALTLSFVLTFAAAVHAESFSGSLAFGASSDFQGELHFTALDPGETSSSFGVFSGYSQAASSDYTYLYYLLNSSDPGTPTSFCDEHCFYGLDLVTALDPTGADIHSITFDDGNGGEAPSFIDTLSPDLVLFEFDDAPNYGVVSDGGFSAFLLFSSPFAPGDVGGAFVTNNLGNFVEITSGVTTPVPEPTTGALLGLGLVALAARRRDATR